MTDRARKRGRSRLRWRLLGLAGVALAAGAWLHKAPRTSGRGSHETPPSSAALAAGYEPTDINARGTAFILAGMAATTLLVVGVVFVMVWRFDIARNQAWQHLLPQQTAHLVPPAPHLQQTPFLDLARLRAREHRLLHDYGWTSPDHSSARIPIDRAMALSVGKSLDDPP